MGHVLYLTSNWQCLVFEVGVMIDRICPAVTRMSIFLVCVGCIQDDMGDEVTFSEFQASRGWLDSNSVKSQQITLKDLVNKGKLLRFSCLVGIIVLLAVTHGPIQTNFLRQTLFQYCSTICLELSPCLCSELWHAHVI